MWREEGAWKSGRHLWQRACLGARASADGTPPTLEAPETRGGTPPWAARSQLLPSPSGRVVGADFTLEHSRVVALGVHPHGVQGLWGERANRDPPPGWEAGGGAGTAWIRAGWTAGRVLEARTARMGRAR